MLYTDEKALYTKCEHAVVDVDLVEMKESFSCFCSNWYRQSGKRSKS